MHFLYPLAMAKAFLWTGVARKSGGFRAKFSDHVRSKNNIICAVQHQYVLQVDMIELKLVSRGPRIKMKRLIQNRAVSVKR